MIRGMMSRKLEGEGYEPQGVEREGNTTKAARGTRRVRIDNIDKVLTVQAFHDDSTPERCPDIIPRVEHHGNIQCLHIDSCGWPG